MRRLLMVLLTAALVLLSSGTPPANAQDPSTPPTASTPVASPAVNPTGETVKVATVHFEPEEGAVAANRADLVRLAKEAAREGAKIIVFPEMATSGYSFFSRAEIATVAETIPGPSTNALAAVADRYNAYIAFGMPQLDPERNLYFNVAVLLGPTGKVEGIYKKRNHLIESAYNALYFGKMPTFDTKYGRLGLVICSDLFYSQFPRATAVQGATILLAPANVGIETDFVKLRAYENDTAVIVANRYGTGSKGEKPTSFSQETFTIPSSYVYDFNWGSRSVIVGHDQVVHSDHSAHTDNIGYGTLEVRDSRTFPVERRPSMYPLLAQDTLEGYTQSQFGQPATTFAAAAVDPGTAPDPWAAALTAAENAADEATTQNKTLRLVVFPGDYFPSDNASGLAALQDFADTEEADLLLGYAESGNQPPRSVLITPGGTSYTYQRSHQWRGEGLSNLSDEYLVVDRDYARVALLQDADMVAPETSHVMARMGVDVVAVNANSDASILSALWQSRTGDYLHIVVANQTADEGIYHGGYKTDPSFVEDEGLVLADLNTADIRTKPTARFFDYRSILAPCATAKNNC
ncbi:nitrilase-related carbon-nitrogen hydrolase [Propionibacterium freudenreichii]|nr:nitrilase-related carbon-nitrogen hydrolase [Propionibacterium freudenreichii]MDK9628491.1 hypothetical protein [Propionibacterium freudenreichii]